MKRSFRVDQGLLREHLRGMGMLSGRDDAGETAIIARQLEYVYAQVYEIRMPALKARLLIPADNTVPNGAESFNYQMWEMIGMAAIITNYADDLPNVDVLAYENPSPIKSLGDVFRYSIQDLRAAVMSGKPIDASRARAARRGIEQAIDYIAAFGDAATGLPGFTNHAGVPDASSLAAHAPWDTASALEILEDMNAVAQSVVEASLGIHQPDTMVLDTRSFGIVASKPMSTTGDSGLTVLKHFLQNSPYITNVDQWIKLNDAGSGNVTRGVCYVRDPEVVQLVIPQEFEQFPPQPKNLAFEVPCHARIGGVCVRYPLGLAYFDGTGESS